MQSRHPPARPHGEWRVRPELDRFLAEVDLLVAPASRTPDHLPSTWPPPAVRRRLFSHGVFDRRAAFPTR